MNYMIKKRFNSKKYETPLIDIIKLSAVDVITASGGDENQGEWDPQEVSDSDPYSNTYSVIRNG